MLIGLNGNKSAGKDTVGQYLVQGHGFVRLSFAEKLKKSAAALFDIPVDSWEKWKNEDQATITIRSEWFDSSDRNPDPALVPGFERSISVRTFLQRYGTESHRDIFGSDFWVDALFRDVDPTDGTNYVITDARFENELKKIKELGGYNIRIERPELSSTDSHASEQIPSDVYIDHIIVNDGSFYNLFSNVELFLMESNTESRPE